MLATKVKVREMVVGVLEAMNAEFPENQAIGLSDATVLVGPAGSLDSLGLVDLVMRLQEVILEEYGVPVAIAGDAVLHSSGSPFRTIEALTEYLSQLLDHDQPS